MTEEPRLTEFSSTDAADSTAEDGDDDAELVEPATITYRWRPEGSTCANCGASTEKQWLDDNKFVCPSCKDWA